MISGLRWTWLALAIWGAVHPLLLFWRYLEPHPPQGLEALAQAWMANAAVRGLTLELVIASLALCIWIVAEVRLRQNYLALIAIPTALLVGISCALPLYLFMRTRPVLDPR